MVSGKRNSLRSCPELNRLSSDRADSLTQTSLTAALDHRDDDDKLTMMRSDTPRPTPSLPSTVKKESQCKILKTCSGITGGIRKFAERYISECGGQKANKHIVNHANKWRSKLTSKYENGC